MNLDVIDQGILWIGLGRDLGHCITMDSFVSEGRIPEVDSGDNCLA